VSQRLAGARAGLGAWLICAALIPMLSGCSLYQRMFHRGGKADVACTEKPFTGNGNIDSRPPLRVPPGLSAPDTRNAIKIPDLGPAAKTIPKTEPCLARPPNFFARPLQPAGGKPAAGKAPTAPPAAAPVPATAPTPASAPAPTPPAPPPPEPVYPPGG